MNQVSRLQTMQADLQRGLAATGDEHRQRIALESLIRNAHFAGVAPLDFIASQLRLMPTTPPATSVAAVDPVTTQTAGLVNPGRATVGTLMPVPTCRKCGREFKSQTALNGHGEARCRNNEPTGKMTRISRPVPDALA